MRPRRILAVMLCQLLALSIAWAEGEAEPPEAPEGVVVNLTPVPEDQKPPDEPTTPVDRAKAKPDDPIIEIAYSGEPFSEVIDDLSQQLGVTIVCNDAKALERKYYRHARISRSRALMAVCGAVMLHPRAGYIVCTEDEARQGDMTPTIKADPQLSMTLTDAALPDTLDYLSELVEIPMAATAGFAETKVTCEVKDAKLSEALAQVAKAVEGTVSRGFILETVNPEAGLEKLESMSDEEIEKLFSDGLKGLQKGQAEGDLPDTQEIKGLMMSGMLDGVRNFSELPAEERREYVGRGAALIRRFAAQTQRLKPETQQQLKTVVKPFLGVIVGGYVGLPAQQKAEFAPLMDAMKAFGW